MKEIIMDADLKIEIPKDEDFLKIYKLILEIADESNNFAFTSEDFGITEINFKNYISSFLNMKNSVFYIAKINDKIVGFAYLEGGKRIRNFHNANLGMGVTKKFRNFNIGKALLKKIIAFALDSDCIAKIDLQVSKGNDIAIALYKKMGFVVEGINKRAAFINGEFVDYINMGLIID